MLASPASGLGDGGDDGSVRKQGLKKAVLHKFLEEYPVPTARPVLQCRQLDKVSSAFVSALPGPSSYIPSPAFSETICSYLCVPSPACRDLVG